MSTSNLIDERYNQYIPRSLTNKYSLENTAELARLWVQNSHKIENILRKQPGEKITTSEGFEVTFSSIDYHTSYYSSHNYEMCFFPDNRYRSNISEDMPWFKYSKKYTYAVYDTKKDSTQQYAYDVMYEIITTLFRMIAEYEVRSESVTVIENAVDRSHEWYRVNDGEYYMQLFDMSDPKLYRYSDWECFSVGEVVETTVIKSVYKCDNPVDLDSAHFITINHNKDIEYRNSVYQYVSEVFTAVREDSSITVEERVMIISEIQSIDSFNNARKSLRIKRKVFKHDVLTKAIDFERKSLDNILFGLYEKL